MKLPDFRHEKDLWNKGFAFVAGCDEVGRGCFAGPVVAAAVIFPKNFQPDLIEDISKTRINDSKKLSALKRERANYWIKKNAVGYGIGSASVGKINKFGIKKASEIAFRKALINTKKSIDYLLIDAFYIPYVTGLRRKNQLPIIHGDERSFSIAAASIIAKVYRDKLMTGLGTKRTYAKYKWIKNKGYGTKDHREAIVKYGVTKYHRKLFVATFLEHQHKYQ